MITVKDKLSLFSQVIQNTVYQEMNEKMKQIELNHENKKKLVLHSLQGELKRKKERYQLQIDSQFDEELSKCEEELHYDYLEKKKTFLAELEKEVKARLTPFFQSRVYLDEIFKLVPIEDVEFVEGNLNLKELVESFGLQFKAIPIQGVKIINHSQGKRYDFSLEKTMAKKRIAIAQLLFKKVEENKCKGL